MRAATSGWPRRAPAMSSPALSPDWPPEEPSRPRQQCGGWRCTHAPERGWRRASVASATWPGSCWTRSPAPSPSCPVGDTGAMRSLAVHHVSINVDELEPAVRFYVDKLGLSVRADRPELGVDGAWLDAGGQQVHLIVGKPPAAEG